MGVHLADSADQSVGICMCLLGNPDREEQFGCGVIDMREILFRGKQKGNGVWLHGDLRQWSEKQKGVCDYDLKHTIEVDSSTIGQYTGMKDKNGNRIFEGDIIKVQYIGSNTGDSGIGTVVFENCMFAIPWGWHKDLVCLFGFCNHTFEVIGNIYDSLEEGDQ